MQRFLKRFTRDERGSVFIFVGLAIIVLVGVVGIALDLGTQGMIKTRMQNAADAAALGGAVADGVSDAERAQIARRYFALNYPDNYQETDLTAANVGITTSGDSVLVDTNMRSRRADLVQVVGVDRIQTRAVSEVQNAGSSTATIRDITLVMDASGSMLETLPTGPIRIMAARDAARVIVDEVICDAPASGSRIGWVKYSSSCDFDAPNQNCNNLTSSLALSASCSDLNNELSAYNPLNWTNGGEGMERAENVMATARPNVVRAVIYMTDGLNNVHGTTNYCPYGNTTCRGVHLDGSPLADAPALDACNRLKAKGVLIYGVSFSEDAIDADVIRACATGPDYFFYAPDEVTLKEAFRSILTSIKQIRITR